MPISTRTNLWLRHNVEKKPVNRSGIPHQGKFLYVKGKRVHVLCKGRGEPVLLLHGNGGIGEEIIGPFLQRRGIEWIAPDRPGYGYSEPMSSGRTDPLSHARWAISLIDRLGLQSVHVVAHSISAGSALCLASAYPNRVRSLTLLAPFCRPTPHRWMLGLRLAVAPGLGGLVRPLIPPLVVVFRKRLLSKVTVFDRLPSTLQSLPIRHIAQPQAVKTIAAELRSFNAGIKHADPKIDRSVPVVALFGELDQTAEPDWHQPWLKSRVARLKSHRHPGAGHMIHHDFPKAAWDAICDAISVARKRP